MLADIASRKLPNFLVVGLVDDTVRERLPTVIKNSRLVFPNGCRYLC